MKTKICNFARRFFFGQSGNTAIEYAIIATLLAGAIIPTIHGLGSALATKLAIAAGITLSGIGPFGP
jgi:Flp pilus assembly pilin Flp